MIENVKQIMNEKIRKILNNLSLGVGRMKINLISLEYLLRDYHAKKKEEPPFSILSINKNDLIKADSYSNYDTLRDLIRIYNADKKNADKIEGKLIIEIRDALAHGRLLAFSMGKPIQLQLFKFGEPNKDNLVKLIFKEELTVEWLRTKNEFLHSQMLKILNASSSLVPEKKITMSIVKDNNHEVT